MNVAIIGTGLIGGSMAIALREKKLAAKIIGVESNKQHAEEALKLGLVDEVDNLDEAISKSDLIILAVPVSVAEKMIVSILDQTDQQIVIDVGSTKNAICTTANKSKKRKRFVATHPMWGTEFSGPKAAETGAFAGNAVVICDKEDSDPDAVEWVEKMYRAFGMNILYMDSVAHDVHAAYVSHISHITSFALANTVLEKEKEEGTIFGMASGGFESTVRLAKSNPDMWVPIFQQNRENVLDVLNEHISQLRKFKSCLEKENYQYLTELIENSNKIKRILK
ncbi:MAG: prephenate dehydrogenase [Bacteroidota bacterium]|jgi:prephenate dehydrogenase|nr:prephenate dehydrogenase [Bacteroidota bacterium]